MVARPRVRMLSRGSRAVLRSNGVRDDIQRRVDAVADAAGAGFEAEVTVGRERVLGAVRATTYEAQRAEAEHYALTRAVDAAR